MQRLDTQDDLDRAVNALALADPRLRSVVGAQGLPRLRQMPATLASLLRIVTDQLISLQAGAAIWSRFEQRFQAGDAGTIGAASVPELMATGLSAAKAKTFLAAAKAIQARTLDFAGLAALSDEEACSTLMRIPGVGPWTAEIFLLFALGRANMWPAGDIALRSAAQQMAGLDVRPHRAAMIALASDWQPWRGAAAHILWSHYRVMRGLPQAK